MDLMTAKEDAKKLSTERKKIVFIEVDGEGEAELSDNRTAQTLHAFQNGNEVPVPPLEEEGGKKVTKKSVPKKAAHKKQSPTKKVTPKKKTQAKKPKVRIEPSRPMKASTIISRATTISLTKAQWDKIESRMEKQEISFREIATSAVIATLK